MGERKLTSHRVVITKKNNNTAGKVYNTSGKGTILSRVVKDLQCYSGKYMKEIREEALDKENSKCKDPEVGIWLEGLSYSKEDTEY